MPQLVELPDGRIVSLRSLLNYLYLDKYCPWCRKMVPDLHEHTRKEKKGMTKMKWRP